MDNLHFHTHIRQHIVVLTGAGISAESGLGTFRGEDGLWKHMDYKKLASSAGFEEDTEAALAFYNHLRLQISESVPNTAHKMLAELEQWHDVSIITQNVDDLHERAGSTNVLHLHGELKKVTSSIHRLDKQYIEEYPLNKPILVGDKAKDGSQLRPFVTMFGEYVTGINKAEKLIREADVFVIIGTSLTVHPANHLYRFAHSEIPCFVIDLADMTAKLPDNFFHIKEKATLGVPILIQHLTDIL